MKPKVPLKQTLLIPAGLALIAALLFHFAPIGSTGGGTGLAANVLATFSDIPATHPNYEAINYIHNQNIVEGYSDGTFRPDNLINRAEFTKIIVETFNRGQGVGSNCFPDVGTDWYAKYVCFSKTHNIISGYPDGNFRPANNINFVEIAKILVNIKGFSIMSNPDTWYKPYVEKLAELKAIPDSITHFDQNVTRGEMAVMIYRLVANVTIKSSKSWTELVTQNAAAPQASTNLYPTLSAPSRLQIPGINVDAAIESVGLTSDGAVGIPKNPADAAWYNQGPRPGDVGSAVITGHVNWYYGQTGVFANLSKVKPGDKITIQDAKGAIITFVVRELRSYNASAQATDVFISTDGKAHLNMITCEGVWDSNSHQYTKRLVVFADRE